MKKLAPGLFISAWAILGASGILVLERYVATPGRPSSPVESWPVDSALPLAPESKTLVMFLHPRCACSRASLRKLDTLMTRLGAGKLNSVVVFTRPPGMTGDLNDEALWRQAQAMRNITVIVDDQGSEALRFGAQTSGHVLVFGEHRQRLFSGGITPARGHDGDSRGEEQIAAVVASPRKDAGTTPIFGCELLGKATAAIAAQL